jgi:predicted nucleic acid-binding protein
MPSLPELPSKSNVLIDANVLVYALTRQSVQCLDLLRRCDVEEVAGFTTVEVLNDVCHRLMLAEAVARGLISRPNAAALKSKRTAISSLRSYWDQMQRVLDSNLLFLELDVSRVRSAERLREQYGLMTTDSTVLAAAFALGIDRLASNDKDFAAVQEVITYYPTDVPVRTS